MAQGKNLNTVTDLYKNLLKIIIIINKVTEEKSNFFLFFKKLKLIDLKEL